jgi:hypothetical protein
MKTAIHVEPEGRDSRLTELKLDEEILTEAVQAGFMQWATCTPNHPPSFPGFSAWSETVKVLRDRLLPHGWERSNEANLPFTVNADGTVAIAVATGDEATGQEDYTPCTKSRKGPRTRKAVAVNNRQLTLFPIEVTPGEIAQLQGEGRRMTWLLLFYRDEIKSEVRFELSRPTKINKDGKVDGWIERILFRPFPFGGDSIEIPQIGSPNDGAINIEIKRRA